MKQSTTTNNAYNVDALIFIQQTKWVKPNIEYFIETQQPNIRAINKNKIRKTKSKIKTTTKHYIHSLYINQTKSINQCNLYINTHTYKVCILM